MATKGSRWRVPLAAVVLATAALALGAEALPAQRPPQTLTWPQLIARSDAVALVEIGRPAARQTAIAVGTGSDFVRHRRNMTVIAVAKAASARARALRAGQTLLVDDVDWQGDLDHHKRCQALKRDRGADTSCPPLADKDGLASQLSREPGSGQQVVVALKLVRGDWQLAAERAMDSAQHWPMLQGLLRGKR